MDPVAATKKCVFFILLPLALISMSGCTAEPPMPLRVGTCARAGCDPLFLARSLGYYKDEQIRIVEYTSLFEILRNFRNGVLDAAAITLPDALYLAQYEPTLRIVAVLNFSQGADAIVAQSDIASIRDLIGKNIGIENTRLGAYVIDRALEIHGLRKQDVHVIPMSSDYQLHAFKAGEIAAVVTYSPYREALLNAGGHIIFDSTALTGEIVEVLAVRNEYKTKYPETLQQLVVGWFAALNYMEQQPNDAARRIAKVRRRPAADVLSAIHAFFFPDLNQNLSLFTGSPPGIIEIEERLLSFLLAWNLMDKPVDLMRLSDATLLRTLEPKMEPQTANK